MSITSLQELVADQFDLSEALTLEDRARLLREVIDLLADLNTIRDELSSSLGADMETDQLPTPWGTLVRSRGGKRTAWDGESVVRHIVRRFGPGVDPETGVILDKETLAARVAEDVAECGGLKRPSHGWRAGELKRRAIPVNSLCSYEEGRTTVRFA